MGRPIDVEDVFCFVGLTVDILIVDLFDILLTVDILTVEIILTVDIITVDILLCSQCCLLCCNVSVYILNLEHVCSSSRTGTLGACAQAQLRYAI